MWFIVDAVLLDYRNAQRPGELASRTFLVNAPDRATAVDDMVDKALRPLRWSLWSCEEVPENEVPPLALALALATR